MLRALMLLAFPHLIAAPETLVPKKPWLEKFLCKVRHWSAVLASVSYFSSHDTIDPTDLSDNELALSAQDNLEHFSDLFDRFFKRVYQFHYFRLRQSEDAEDLTSITFTKVFEKLHTFEEKGIPFTVWLFTIARNSLIDHVRKKKVEIDSIDDLTPDKEPSEDFDLSKLESSVLSKPLWEAIGTLPEKHQQVWALKLSSDPPHKEIAEILGTSENNVNVIVSRSLAVLKKRLAYLK